jgi:hypothetical protein
MRMSRQQLKNEILISARIAELRRVGDDAAEWYTRALAASGLPEEHFKLRLILRNILPSPSKDE